VRRSGRPALWPASGGGDGRLGFARQRPALRRRASVHGLGRAALVVPRRSAGCADPGVEAADRSPWTEAQGPGRRPAGGDPGRPRPLALVGRRSGEG
jgi:hypothetical protein